MRQSAIRERQPEPRRSPLPPPPPEGALPSRPSRLPLSPQSPRDEAHALVHRLSGCGPEEVAAPIERLVALGEPALDVLARAFPGPLWPTAHPVAPVDFCTRSPVGAALVAFGDAAWPHVEWLMQAPTIRVRAQAVELALALARPELMPALVLAALDEERSVREAAVRVLRGLSQPTTLGLALEGLRARLHDGVESKVRRRALDALVDTRDGSSATALVELLGDSDRALGRQARLGLTRITGHDFGDLRDGWSRWLSANGARSRAEWLRSGLSDRREDIASLAARELLLLGAGEG